MTNARDTYHHGDLRNALVSSAVRLLESGGTSAFSLREAAREVGVSANAAYRHFDDKSALMAAVAADGFARLAARMQRAMKRAAAERGVEPTAIARLKAAGRAYVEFALDQPAIFRVMFGECSAAGRDGEGSALPADSPWGLLGQCLDALVTDGLLLAEGREGAELKAWTVVHGFAALALDGLTTTTTQKARAAAIESLLDFAVAGLCSPSPTWSQAVKTRRPSSDTAAAAAS
jgi:AcrR family transcriptional regulator